MKKLLLFAVTALTASLASAGSLGGGCGGSTVIFLSTPTGHFVGVGTDLTDLTPENFILGTLSENVSVPSSTIVGMLGDDKVAISTAGVVDGKFGDDKVDVSTGAVSAGLFGDNRVAISTGGVSAGTFGDNRISVSTGAVASGKFGDARVAISTGAISDGKFGDDRVEASTNAIVGSWQWNRMEALPSDSKANWDLVTPAAPFIIMGWCSDCAKPGVVVSSGTVAGDYGTLELNVP